MGLIQQDGLLAEYGAGCGYLAILSPSLMTSTAPLLRKSSLPLFEPEASTTWPAGCFTTGKPASLLSKAAASGISEGILGFLPYFVSAFFNDPIAVALWTGFMC
jgi:hypothetical protein